MSNKNEAIPNPSHKYTKQATFDKVVRHLRKQGKKALTKENRCVLLTEDGLKCAVGCLIPSALYDPGFEGPSLKTIVTDSSGCYKFVSEKQKRLSEILSNLGHDFDLLYDLQSVHDEVSIDKWENSLSIFAEKHSLKYTPPNTNTNMELSTNEYSRTLSSG